MKGVHAESIKRSCKESKMGQEDSPKRNCFLKYSGNTGGAPPRKGGFKAPVHSGRTSVQTDSLKGG